MAEGRKDYLLAFAIGAILAIGATLLLATGRKRKRRGGRLRRSLGKLR